MAGRPMAVTRTCGADHRTLVTFIDRVIVPALVERFLVEHHVQRPDRNPPLAKSTDAA